MNRYLFLLVLVTSQGSGFATGAEKPAWLWTSDERIVERFDRDAMRTRRERMGNRLRLAPPNTYVIDGKQDPELFFPWELLDGLLQAIAVEPSRAAHVRASYRSAIKDNNWDYDTFWREVDSATAVYANTRKQQADHRLQLAHARKREGIPVNGGISPHLVNELCSDRAEALTKLRRVLGRESFDRFLYAAVAPGMTSWMSSERDAEMLNRIERGCR